MLVTLGYINSSICITSNQNDKSCINLKYSKIKFRINKVPIAVNTINNI